ncbi:Gamma-butyrobetaine dioxygenase [Chlamydia trachomatis]|nr:Gamma-butyrobetaine dioxygenase [Chlamydia trachomatis]
MKQKYPESYEIFCRIPVPAHSAGEEKVCIQPDEYNPIFKLDDQGQLLQVRWNQSDRSTMDNWENPETDIPRFYQAIRNWVEIITSPENEMWYQMKPGQCLIFDNWRVFHLRSEFTGKRRLCGAYFERDDFVSRLKLLVLGRQAVLDAI